MSECGRMDVHLEQRVNIKFCVKLGKTATQTYELLRGAYGNETSRVRVFEWHKRFVSGRTSVKDDTRQGRPAASWNENNVARIREIVQQDRTITVRMLSNALDISKTTRHQILHETWGNES